MPSPVEDRPGLLIRDSFRYSDSVLIIPPPLVRCLSCFDGLQTQLDLRAMLVEILGQLQVGDLEDQLIDVLTRSGFLEDETFQAMKAQREREFAEASARLPTHAGSGISGGARGTATTTMLAVDGRPEVAWGISKDAFAEMAHAPSPTLPESPRRTSVLVEAMSLIAPLTDCSARTTRNVRL